MPAPANPTTSAIPALSAPPASNSLPQPDTCVICLDTITERAITVPCNHVCFDFLCLASWAAAQPAGRAACPLCKTPLAAIEYDWRAPDDFKRYVLDGPRDGAGAEGERVSRTAPPYWARGQHRRGRGRGRGIPRQPRPFGRTIHSDSARDEEAKAEAALQRRRDVYARGLFSLHIGSNRISRFRDFTPADMVRSAELQSRARWWIRRELRVFRFLDARTTHAEGEATGRGQNTEFMLSYIIAILKVVDIKSSTGVAEEKIAEMLGTANARLFLHELESWLRSPFTQLEDWDRVVQYREGNGKRFYAGDSTQAASEMSTDWEGSRQRDVLRRYEPD